MAGFTLIELLVVLVITGILVAALTLAIGDNGARELENASDRFQALLGHACNEAELGGREIGATLDDHGFAFKHLEGTVWRDFDRDGELRPRRWPQGARVELAREGRPVRLAANPTDAPQLVCFSSGELTPFTLTLMLGDPPVRYRVQGEDDGRTKRTRLDAQR